MKAARLHAYHDALKLEQIEGWIKKGAQPSDHVARFLSQHGLVEWAHGNNPNKGKPGKKADERAGSAVLRLWQWLRRKRRARLT